MKRIIYIIAISALISLSFVMAQEIDYFTDSNKIGVAINGQVYDLINFETEQPAYLFSTNSDFELAGRYGRISLIEDLDNDGYKDAIASFSTGGNCCAPSYAVISVLPDGSFRFQPLIDWSWGEPTIKNQGESKVIEFISSNSIYSYTYQSGKVALVDERKVLELSTLAEIRVFDILEPEAFSEIPFDFDGDGTAELLVCQRHSLRSLLYCGIQDSSRNVIQNFSLMCDRYGILTTTTNGVNDIVCNEQTVGQWNGSEFIWSDY